MMTITHKSVIVHYLKNKDFSTVTLVVAKYDVTLVEVRHAHIKVAKIYEQVVTLLL